MQKIGLILANPGTNYGAHLQAYATQYAIDNLGVETEVVECLSTPVRGHYYMDLGLVVDLYHSICKKFLKKNRKPTYDKAFQLNKKERVKLAKQFRNERLHDFRNFNDYKSLVEGVRNYDAILINDVPSEIRNDIVKACFATDKRVYFTPKISDILIKPNLSCCIVLTV